MAPDEPRAPARITIAGAERLDDCRALWLELRDHHGGTDPQHGPLRDDEDSWARARAEYGPPLATPDGFLVLAEDPDGDPGDPLGCAIVNVTASPPTWAASDRCGNLEVLSVSARARGLGIGRALMDAIAAELARRDVHETRLLVTAGNLGAQAFYRELGFDPFAVIMRKVDD